MVSSVDGIESEVLCSMMSPPIFPNPAQFQVLRELGSRLNSEPVPLDKRSRTVTTRDSQKHPKTHLEVGTEKGDCSKYPELIIIGPEKWGRSASLTDPPGESTASHAHVNL